MHAVGTCPPPTRAEALLLLWEFGGTARGRAHGAELVDAGAKETHCALERGGWRGAASGRVSCVSPGERWPGPKARCELQASAGSSRVTRAFALWLASYVV